MVFIGSLALYIIGSAEKISYLLQFIADERGIEFVMGNRSIFSANDASVWHQRDKYRSARLSFWLEGKQEDRLIVPEVICIMDEESYRRCHREEIKK